MVEFVGNEDDMITLADCVTLNVMDQLEIDNPALAAEIAQVMRNEIRNIEINFSMAIADMRKIFAEDIAALKASGTPLPDGHMLNVLQEIEDARK